MSDRLGFADLMAGGLHELRRHPIAVALFVAANGLAGYLASWAEGLGVSLTLLLLASFAAFSPISSLFLLALGDKLRDMVVDPVDLIVRLVFALAVTLLVTLGSGIGALLFIIPGFYINARWTLAQPLVLLEGCGIGEAMGRSWRLTEAVAWPLVGTVLVLGIANAPFLFFGSTDQAFPLASLSPLAVLQNLVGSGVAAVVVGISVFANRELSDQPNRLAETFA
jgi:hypothetical protein